MRHRFLTGFLTYFCCLLFTCSSLHFEMRQVWAWSTMLIDFQETTSFAEAFQDTFSGQKPCEHCISLTQEQTAEQDTHSLTSLPGNFCHWILLAEAFTLSSPGSSGTIHLSPPPLFRTSVPEAPQPPPPISFS